MIQITNKENCCGCSSCAQRCPTQCIKMQEDNEGFLYPKVEESSCIDCGLCEKVCPVIKPFEKHEPQKFLAAINKNEAIRLQSSSGGIFTLLAERVIKDGGVVFGARFDDDWQVTLDYTETMEGLAAFRGSKYVQARTGDTYKQCERFLKDGREVLYSGTPCQVAGLKHFLRREYGNLLTVDFACHGVPSPLVWRKYLEEISNTAVKAVDGKSTVLSSLKPMSFIRDIRFRDKSDGWKKYRFVLKFNEPQGDVEQSSVLPSTDIVSQWFRTNIYMKGFLNNMILRPSCFDCKVKEFRSHSDITVADYWGVKKTMPDFDDDKGVSIVFVNSAKSMLEISTLDCLYREVSKSEALVGNPVLYHSAKPWYNRETFFKKINNINRISMLMKKELKPTFSMKVGKGWYVVKILSTLIRNKIKKHK